eukprot:1160156-Pelagomonas_calceolata.AAC.3
MQGRKITSYICSGRKLAASTLTSQGKTNHHVSSPQNVSYFPVHTVHYQHPFSSRALPSLNATFSLTSNGRFQCVVPQAFGADDSCRGEACQKKEK